MFDDLDEALRKLLVRELPIKNGEVDIQFHQPKREWSARLSRPTLNLFLYDLRENVKLRQHSPQWIDEPGANNQVIQRRLPARVELFYLVTAWAKEPEDEHRLLARTLLAFFRTPHLPDDLLPESLQHQPAPIELQAAQPGNTQNPADFWGAMDNEIRPGIYLLVMMALDPYTPITTPLVRFRELIFRDQDTGVTETPGRILWTVTGHLRGKQPWQQVKVVLVELEREAVVQPDGNFILPGIPEGTYTLEATVANGPTRRYPLTVPAREYEWEL